MHGIKLLITLGKHKHSVKNQSESDSRRQPQSLLSLSSDELFRRELRITAWSVAAVIFWGEAIVKAKREKTFVITLAAREKRSVHVQYGLVDGSITVSRADLTKLNNFPKPARDQLIILLSTEMGFRSGEVATLRIENIDLDKGNVLVLDSKKYRLYPIPLTYQVARTIEEVLAEDKRDEGYIIQQHDRCAWRRGKPVTTIGLCDIWKRWARRAGIRSWQQYTPTLGRHYFAAWWHYVKHGNLEILRRILRHKHLTTTQVYLSKLIFYEDVKAEMQRLQVLPIKKTVEGCEKSEICKFYKPSDSDGCQLEPICRFNAKEVQTP